VGEDQRNNVLWRGTGWYLLCRKGERGQTRRRSFQWESQYWKREVGRDYKVMDFGKYVKFRGSGIVWAESREVERDSLSWGHALGSMCGFY